ncbi:MAG TPA: glycosyl hydrolase 53 family protein [Hanamia sp.]|nr:glycosyl hydrolase 53 family protein [Hanamia sp.]
MKYFFLVFVFGFLSLSSCSKKTNDNPVSPPPADTTILPVDTSSFARGADVSWVTQMESQGIKFYNKNGAQQDLFQILKDEGMNSIRLRVWVNPPGGWCNTADVVAKSLRAKAAGMKILIDFHYSDTWADPGDQTTPAAWQNQTITQLDSSVNAYTTGVLDTLKLNGISPDWVQVGNETNDGMLWPEGRASVSMANFASLINAGYDAVKSVFPSTKVIVHISNGFDNTLFRWMFDGLQSNGAKWDVIGMSLYPTASNWTQLNAECLANMNDMVSRYNKEVMVCEVGMSVSDSVTCKNFISDLIQKSKSVANNKCLGVFYWEPECYNGWNGYLLGAFNNAGEPTIALDAFK